jgi:hypothetical protein
MAMRALMLVSLVACSNAGARSEDLLTDVRTFQEGLRWRKYEMAADHVPATVRERFLEAHDELDEDLRIDDYELMRVKLESAGNDAYVRVKYTWHRESVGTVHETVVEQHWERQGKVWRIVASEHQRGERLPPSVVVSRGSALP